MKLPDLLEGTTFGFSTGFFEDDDDLMHIFDSTGPMCYGEDEYSQPYRLEYEATASDLQRVLANNLDQMCHTCEVEVKSPDRLD